MQMRTHRSIFSMAHKKRIGWFLTLQHVVKRLRNRIAPPLLPLKKQSKFFKGKTLESALVILHQSISLQNPSKIPAPAQPTSYDWNKVRTPNLNSGRIISTSSMPTLIPREYQILPKMLQLNTKLDHRFLVTPSFEHDPKRYRTRIEQLKPMQGLSLATTEEAIKSVKKASAPTQTFSPPPLHVNDKFQEVTHLAENFRTISKPFNQPDKVKGSILEQSLFENFNAMSVQKTESAVDQDQPSISSNASASTLYLDGLSLGRWTTQHLERVLSKPPSGITGVDPRATVPRGRVAPF